MVNAMQDEKMIGKVSDSKLMFRLLRYLRPYKIFIGAALLLLLLGAPLSVAGPPLTKAVIDLVLAPEPATRLTDFEILLKTGAERVGLGQSPYQGVIFISIIFLLAQIASFVIQAVQAFLLQLMGQRIMFDLRNELFEKLQQIPLQFYDRNPIGRLMTRLTTDVDTLNEMFTGGLILVIGDIAIALYIVFYMFIVNWRLALISFTILPLLIGLTTWFRRRSRQAFRDVRACVAHINAFLQERLTSMSLVQLFNQEEKEERKFGSINQRHRDANINTVFYYALFYPAVEVVGALGVALIIWFGGGQVIHNLTTIGTLIAFIQLTRLFYEPISDISERYNILQSAMASAERIFDLLDAPVALTSPANSRRLGRAEGRIEFRNVWFAYNNEDWVLKDVSFVVEPGEKVAFVGHTGAGKTTITNLLLRFHEIQRGQILLDGVDVCELDVNDLRANLGVVLQDAFLFSGDVAHNIRLGDPSIADERVYGAAREAQADKFIQRLPAQYATPLSERGANLSAGQRQLISFARALAFDPRILILDEATSSIDTETEILIRDAIERLLENRTSLVIAHRLSTIQSVDKIILLHKGSIRETGTHQDLLAQRQLYWRLYNLQFPREQQDLEVVGVAGD
jgi:ATP-binding cassette subfamily B protein